MRENIQIVEITLDAKAPENARVKMNIAPGLVEDFKDSPFFLEIEILQGDRRELANGNVELLFEVNDLEKVDTLKEFLSSMELIDQ